MCRFCWPVAIRQHLHNGRSRAASFGILRYTSKVLCPWKGVPLEGRYPRKGVTGSGVGRYVCRGLFLRLSRLCSRTGISQYSNCIRAAGIVRSSRSRTDIHRTNPMRRIEFVSAGMSPAPADLRHVLPQRSRTSKSGGATGRCTVRNPAYWMVSSGSLHHWSGRNASRLGGA